MQDETTPQAAWPAIPSDPADPRAWLPRATAHESAPNILGRNRYRLDWLIRFHRPALEEAGALMRVGKEDLVNIPALIAHLKEKSRWI